MGATVVRGGRKQEKGVSSLGDPDRYLVPFAKVLTATVGGEAEMGRGL